MANKSPIEWAHFNVREYERCLSIWEKSLDKSKPDYNALVGAYKHLYGAEINFLDAKDRAGAKRAGNLRKKFARVIEKMMGSCGPAQAVYIWNSAR